MDHVVDIEDEKGHKKKLGDLKFESEVAKLTYQAARDSMRSIQSELSALQSILRSQEEI